MIAGPYSVERILALLDLAREEPLPANAVKHMADALEVLIHGIGIKTSPGKHLQAVESPLEPVESPGLTQCPCGIVWSANALRGWSLNGLCGKCGSPLSAAKPWPSEAPKGGRVLNITPKDPSR